MMGSVVIHPASAFAAPAVPAAPATGGGWSSACVVEGFGSDGDKFTVATIQGAQCILANILSIAVSGIGLIGFVMFLIGSFTYLLSGGNSKGTEGARNTFTYAVVGLVVALSAVIILRIIASFTGVQSILNFHIPSSSDGLP